MTTLYYDMYLAESKLFLSVFIPVDYKYNIFEDMPLNC